MNLFSKPMFLSYMLACVLTDKITTTENSGGDNTNGCFYYV